MTLEELYTQLVFWEQIKGDAKRIILCPPDHVEPIRAAIVAHGCQDILTVRSNPCCPPEQLIIIDAQAIEAASRQALQRLTRRR